MSDASIALGVFAVLVAGTYVLFRPTDGYYWRMKRTGVLASRVLLEDALKHMYDFEYHNRTPTVESLAGQLSIAVGGAADLLIRAERLGLVRSEGGRIKLTVRGREGALRVIRVHRLWEHYLAEETSHHESDWHRQAELYEHRLSDEEVEDLADRMGHPAFDPHGDPIPTAKGEIMPERGKPLSATSVGDVVTVVHVEDEPETVYAQLVAEGVYPGMRIEVFELAAKRIRFWGDDEEHRLAPIVAANVSVAPVPAVASDSDEITGPAMSSLGPGEKGRVVRIVRKCRGLERRRLLDLGIIPGTVVEAVMKSPTGDPTAFRVRGSTVALRRDQTDLIQISEVSE